MSEDMKQPNALRALPPAWFRFTDEDDKGKFGDGWFKYDEGQILRLPARSLIELEAELGMPMVAVMNGFRDSTALGELAILWLGVRSTDPARAGDFDNFNPIIGMVQYTADDPEPEGKSESSVSTPERPDSETSLTPTPLLNTNSEKTGTVVLVTMPIEESST